MNITELLKNRITKPCGVIFPEATEPAILEAAYKAYREGICHPIFIGEESAIKAALAFIGITESFYSVIVLEDEQIYKQYAERYYESNQIFSVKRLKN